MTQRYLDLRQEAGKHHRHRVRLSCPSCGYRVGDVSPQSRMRIRLAEDEPEEPADLYIKCGRCKAEIAVQKTE